MVSSHWPNPLEEGKMIRYFLHEWQSHKCQLESPFLSMLGFGIILLKVTSLTLHGISLKCNVIVVKFMKLGRKCFSSSQEILGGGGYWGFPGIDTYRFFTFNCAQWGGNYFRTRILVSIIV